MPNRIIKAAVHHLRKTDDGLGAVHGRDDLPITATTQRLIDELHDLYARRSSKSHGKFSDDVINFPTQTHLRAYFHPSPIGFGALTSSLMTTLQVQARRRPNAAGGHVFFAHLERDGQELLLVAIVNDKLSAALTEDDNVQDVNRLDMEGFRFAGRINVTGWQAGESRYIGFLRGKGDVAEYFKEFLGCDTSVQDAQDTKSLVRELKNFAEMKGLDAAAKDEFLRRACAICDRVARESQAIEFGELANELTPTDPGPLRDFLADPEKGLSDGFVPNRRALTALLKFKARTRHWAIEFDREAISTGECVFDPVDNSLTIPNLPPDLAAALRAEKAADVVS